MHDRIGLTYGRWVLRTRDNTGFQAFFKTLTEPDFGINSVREDSDMPWFVVARRSNPDMQILNVARGGSGRGPRPSRPLFGGVLKPRYVRGNTEDDVFGLRELSLDLTLNPTRFIHHQATRWSPTEAMHELPQVSLRAGEALLESPPEASQDRNDNILIGNNALLMGERFQEQLERYWGAVQQQLNCLFERAASSNTELSYHPTINLRNVETYWEFAIEDAVGWVRSIKDVSREFAVRFAALDYVPRSGTVPERLERNTTTLQMELSQGVLLRVYAKTNRRVRFEIEHDLTKAARLLGGGHTSSDPDALTRWLRTISENAVERVNRFLSFLATKSVREGRHMSVTQLIVRVTQAVGDAALAERLLANLAYNGSIDASGDPAMNEAVRKLKRVGILETVREHASRSSLVPAFERARRDLAAGHIAAATSDVTEQ